MFANYEVVKLVQLRIEQRVGIQLAVLLYCVLPHLGVASIVVSGSATVDLGGA
jgi:hypothetical protein